MTDVATQPPTYGNWRRPATAGILGLGSIGTAGLMAGLVVVVLVVMVRGLIEGLVLGLVLALAVLLLTVRDSHGKSALDRIAARVGWMRARAAGSNIYRSGPLGRALWGTFQLPGIAAPTRLSEHMDSYRRPFALIEMPHVGSYSIVIAAEPDGAALVDPEQVDQWVASWGHWLARLGDEPGIEAASVTIETAPDTGSRLRREVQGNIDPNAPAFARAVLSDVVDAYPHGSSSVSAYVALTFSASHRGSSKKATPEEMARELAPRMAGMTAMLHQTGAGAAHPVSAAELCELVRVAYDPAAAGALADAATDGEDPQLQWQDVGPTAAEAAWDHYRHDSATSVTWAMTTAPRGNVHSSILSRLLAPSPRIARKRVTLLYRPLDSARAAAIVEADLRAMEFRATATAKPAARDLHALRAARVTATEEAAGAGLVNFGMLVTATVQDAAQLEDAKATVDNLGAIARLRLRILYGSQDAAFAAALPLGLVLSKHATIPAELRDRL